MSEVIHGFRYQKDSDGIVTITMDMDGPVNAMNDQFRQAMSELPSRLEREEGLRGVVLASDKSTFFAGGDLKALVKVPKGGEQAHYHDMEECIKAPIRRIEKLQVPVVAAINGAAMGGGLEICLATNHRIAWNSKKVIIALPEVTLGLLPGAGGVVRTIHMLGLKKALPLLLEGVSLGPGEALEAGWIDELVDSAEELVPAAKQWIKNNPEAWANPWDIKGHKIPGGDVWDRDVINTLTFAPAELYKKTRGLLPAPKTILAIAGDTMAVDFDTACRIESRKFVQLASGREAKNIITANFFQMGKVKKDKKRFEEILSNEEFISRVSTIYTREGALLVGEGVNSVLVEAMGKKIGMPEGPKVSGPDADAAEGEANDISHQDIKDRLLVAQVVESLKCLEEGVLGTVAEINICSLLSTGAPMWTGGFLQVINTWEHGDLVGLVAFTKRAEELKSSYGERFSLPSIVGEKIKNEETFI